MASPLPWWRVATGTRDHAKVLELCAALQHDTADAFLFRLWDYCAERLPSGLFPGASAGLLLERAVRWGGAPGALARAMTEAGLVDVVEAGLLVHDWPEWQKALAAKFERDRSKPSSAARPHGIRAEPLRSPLGTSPLSSLVVGEEVQEKGVAPDPAQDPEAGALGDQLAAVFADVRRAAFTWTRAEEMALAALLSLAGARGEAEVVRRWRVALAARWPRCSSLRTLASNWNEYAAAEQPSQTRSAAATAPRRFNSAGPSNGPEEKF